MSEITVTPKWITDEDGNKIAPKTLASQVYDSDGESLFHAIKFNRNDTTIIPDSEYLKGTDVINNLTSTDTDKPLSANMGKQLAEKGTSKKAVLSGSVSVPASTWTAICNVEGNFSGRYLAIARVSNSYSVTYARISHSGNVDNTLLNQPYGTANLEGVINIPANTTRVSLYVYASAFTATANNVTLELIKL